MTSAPSSVRQLERGNVRPSIDIGTANIAVSPVCGEPALSPEDAQMTREAARLLGIDLLHRVIIGEGRFVSFKERGVL